MHAHSRLTRRQLSLGTSAAVTASLFPDLGETSAQPASPTLREVADELGFGIGCAMSSRALSGRSYRELVSSQFNVAANAGLHFAWIRPTERLSTFSASDAIDQFAESHDMQMDLYHAIWGRQTGFLPDYILEKIPTGELDVLEVVAAHVTEMGKQYEGRIHTWSVVNEPFSDWGGYKSEQVIGTDEQGNPIQEWGFWNVHSPWSTGEDPDYIEVAFHTAHEVAPNARLMLNEYAAETFNAKSETMYWAVVRQLNRGVPIHTIGLQGAFDMVQVISTLGITGAAENMGANVQRFLDLGLEVDITELQIFVDGLIHSWGMSVNDAYIQQAELVRAIMATCASPEFPRIKRITIFGANDDTHWHNTANRPDSDPTLFAGTDMKHSGRALLDGLIRLRDAQ